MRNKDISNSTSILGETVNSVLDSTSNQQFLNQSLGSIDVSSASPSHLVAVLTSLFTWRSELTEWKPLCERAAEYYRKQGIDVGKAFRGLL